MQLKRRDTQSQISTRIREAMLLSRRMRRQKFSKHRLLESLIVVVPEQATLSWDKTGFLKQTALTIREPPSLAEKGTKHQAFLTTLRDNLKKEKGILDTPIICEIAASLQTCTTTVMDNLEKEKSILDPPIIRETGPTSGTSKLPPVSLNAIPIKVDGFLDMEDESLQKGKRKRDTVSCREYYCYKFQIRDNETNEVIHCGRIFQQFIVDVYIKLETQRLDFFSFNPDLFRIEFLQRLLDILRFGEREASKIGKKTFLPVTFIGGPRDMRRRYMDAIALIQYFGKPDFFITMTCNPSWPEIKEHLLLADEVQNRPDLVIRIFRAKVEELKIDILKRQIFGRVVGFMYTIEFKKCGLPHAHFLIILADEHKLLTPESYDKFVCAELPDSKKDRDLYLLVIKHMMHVRCGKGRIHIQYTEGEIGEAVEARVCSDIKVVKYIYKYICKGHDKITFHIHASDTDIDIDEIKEYQSARWVSPPEAAWRLLRFPISEMTPSVFHLQLHLEGQQFVSFKSIENVDRILSNLMIRKTMLTEFFVMNRTNKDAMQLLLLYKEFPEYFVWSFKEKMWTRRTKGNVIGRVVTCHPTEGERYYLRLLLMNVRGPKSYQDLCKVDGKYYNTFREAAEKRGLLHCDNNLVELYCNPSNLAELWKQFEDSMSEDFKILPNMNAKDIRFMALNHINDVLHFMRRDINKYNLIPEKIKLSAAIRETNDSQIFSNKSGALFVDGPGGIGKTFPYRALLVVVRSKGFVALATASSALIRDAKLIVWDEVSMAKKKVIETFNILLKDLMDTNALFGGKEVEVAKESGQSSDAKVKCEMEYPTCLDGESQKVDTNHVDNSLLCGELLASYIDSFAHNLGSSTKRLHSL
ncbi:uncharacterized protein LOC107824485 [Nicotiana tabacum]|uniref:Uncharacterized protein LOC107824485 n=1 Tax=Nicotiana tabacum TaxID=4097 RepID=A0AC58S666_TOBAC